MATSPTSGPGGGGVTAPATIGPGAAGVVPLDLRVPDATGPAVTFGNNTWDTDPTDPSGGIYAEDDGSLRVYAHGFQRLMLQAISGAVVFRGFTAAPADAQVGNGDFALWLDGTPAATKLMVKAKDTAGTVRTATIALA